MTTTAAFKEILTDVHSDPAGVMRRVSFLDEAMPAISETLNQTYESVAPMIQLLATLQGLSDDEVGKRVRENALQGSFALGVIIGMEFQKRGYVPAPDPTLDVPGA